MRIPAKEWTCKACLHLHPKWKDELRDELTLDVIISSSYSSCDETLYFILMLSKHVVQTVHGTSHKIPKAL